MNRSLLLLVSVFVAGVVVTNVIGTKIMTLFGLNFTAGMLAYCVTFPITDTIGEVWGKRHAQTAVWGGLIGNFVMVLLVYLAIVSEPAVFWGGQQQYSAVLGMVPRIVFASMLAYLVSQLHDVWAFHFWSKVTKGKHLWLRNNLSTATSQLIDSAIFVSVAFWGVLPSDAILTIFVGQYLIKLLIAAIDTPAVYALVWLCRKNLAPDGANTSKSTND